MKPKKPLKKRLPVSLKKLLIHFSSKQAVLKDMAAKKDSVKSEIIAVIESGTVLLGNEDIEQVAKELKSLKKNWLQTLKIFRKNLTHSKKKLIPK